MIPVTSNESMSSGSISVTESELLSRAIEMIDRTNWNQVAHLLSQLRPTGRWAETNLFLSGLCGL
jgi:hypothetical protein